MQIGAVHFPAISCDILGISTICGVSNLSIIFAVFSKGKFDDNEAKKMAKLILDMPDSLGIGYVKLEFANRYGSRIPDGDKFAIAIWNEVLASSLSERAILLLKCFVLAQ